MNSLLTSLQNQRRKVLSLGARGVPAPDYVDALIDLANMASQLDYGQSLGILKEARVYAELMHYDEGLCVVLTRLAWVLLQQGKVDQALIQATRSRVIADQNRFDALRLSASHVIALIHQRAGEYTRADAIWRQIAIEAKHIGDSLRIADAEASLAILLAEQRDYHGALPYLQSALAIYQSHRDTNQALVLNALGVSLTELGAFDDARACVDQGLAICPTEMPAWRSALLHTRGKVELATGAIDLARRAFTQALNLAREFNCDIDSEGPPLLDLARIASADKDIAQALSLLEGGLARASAAQHHDLKAQFHQALHGAYVAAGAFEVAGRHMFSRESVVRLAERDNSDLRGRVAMAEIELAQLTARWRNDIYVA
jgi:tetratricopeptide (TPR) repeat protein